MNLSQFKTDVGLVTDGAWFAYDANKDGTIPRVKLARLSAVNPKYARLLKAMQAQPGDNMSDEEADKRASVLFVDSCVIVWEHFQPNDDGKEIPFSRDTALQLINDPAWRDLSNDWRNKATAINGFAAKSLEDTIKN